LLKKLLLPLILLFSLNACSTKVGYFFLDWAIEWEVEEYVNLDKSQQKQFDALVEKFLVWHREVELPKYSAQLQELLQLLQQDKLTTELWVSQVDQAKAHWFRIFHFLLPELVPLMASLSDVQVTEIIAQLKKEEQELSDEYAGKSQAELIEKSDKSLIEQADDWLGSLTDEQKALIHQNNSQRLATLDMWLEYRHEWLRVFEQALSRRDNSHLLTQNMIMLMTQPDNLKSEIHKQKLLKNTENFGALLINLNHTLQDKQRKKFNKKLNALINDLNELSLD
jgi:truncated hemoglobin YjbI